MSRLDLGTRGAFTESLGVETDFLMRVSLISQDLHDGGAARCVRDLLEGLPAHGVEVRAIVADAGNHVCQAVEEYRQPWERWLSFLEAFPGSTDWRHRGAVKALARIGTETTDVVHLHVVQNGATSIRAVHDLCLRMPAVWTLHDEWAISGGLTSDLRGLVGRDEVLRYASGIRRRLGYSPYHDSFRFRDVRRVLDRWMPQPRIVLTPSYAYASKAQASGRFPNSEIRVVRNGVALADLQECSLSRDQARAHFSLPPNRPILLLLASHLQLPVKGIVYGIEALNRMKSIPHTLLVGGDADLIRPFIRGDVTCLPRQGDVGLAKAYRAADVTLIPSLAESFSLVAGESMACGTPVVGFSVGGLGELIGANERGLAARPFDTLEMSLLIEKLLNDGNMRRTLGEAGRVLGVFGGGFQRHIRSIVTAYSDAINGARISQVDFLRLTAAASPAAL